MTASKPELSQSNFTAPPVSKKIPQGGKEGGRQGKSEGRKEMETKEKF